MTYKSLLALALVTLSIVGAAIYFVATAKTRNLDFEWQELVFNSVRTLEVRTNTSSRLLALINSSEVRVVRLDTRDAEARQTYLNHLDEIKAQYQSYQAPYPGFVSQKVICQPHDLPTPIAGGLAFYSNERFVPVGCSGTDEGVYYTEVTGTQCANGFYIVKIFLPKMARENQHYREAQIMCKI